MEISNMSFFGIEPFEAPKHRNFKPAAVRLTVSDTVIVIPVDVYKKFGSPKFAEVGFNTEKKFFAIRPTDGKSKYSIPLTFSHGAQISSKVISDKICELHPWDRSKKNLILDHGNLDPESGYWLFDLDCAVEAERRMKKGRK